MTGIGRRRTTREPWICPETPDGEHVWTPVSFVMSHGMPDPDAGRLYCVCMPCHAHTYLITEWVGYCLETPSDDDD